jgi:hypothetical protein
MKLDDLQKPMTSEQISALLKKHHDIQIPLSRMNKNQVRAMMESVNHKLQAYRNSRSAHYSEQDPNYTAMLMVEQALHVRLLETDNLAKMAGREQDYKKQISESAMGEIVDAARGAGEKIHAAIRGQYVKPATRLSDIARSFRRSLKMEPAELNRYTHSADASDTPEELLHTASRKLRISSAEMENLVQKLRHSQPLTASEAQQAQKILQYLTQHDLISESVHLSESAMGEAEVILAAKDLADRLQDMVEALGKMVNEELPALVETVRDTMTAEQADSFNSSALETLNNTLNTVRASKEALDSAARTLAGEEATEVSDSETLPDETPEPDQTQSPEPDDQEDVTDQLLKTPSKASGAKDSPLGRGKR